MIRWYPLLSAASVVLVVLFELFWARTGIFRQWPYWAAMGICFAFMIPVDGWMSKLSDPIVIYNPQITSGLRFPWDIPTEEFLYAFAIMTLAIVMWDRVGTLKSQAGTLER